jgi:RimJ/RimL family protein N-acetyltransferase
MDGVTRLLAPAVLEGRHVRLEPLALDHLTDLLDVGLDPDLWRWSPDRIEAADDLRRYLARALAERERGEALPFAIVERAGGRAIGATRYANAAPEHRRIEIGWTWIGRAWQRTAVNTETKWLMLRHAFETLGCLRVELKTDALNVRSRAAILGIGATEEGTLRSHMVTHDGRFRDSVYFSVLASEWPRVRAGLEARLERHG